MTIPVAPVPLSSLSSETPLAPETLQAIVQDQTWRQHRVLRMDTLQGKIVIKGQRPARGVARYKLLNLIAAILRAPFLKAAPAWGGARAQEVEVTRLQTLKSCDLPVPEILHVDSEFFVMKALGESDLAHTILTEPKRAYDAWLRGGTLLLQVHSRSQYLSQAFARNFLLHEDELGLIDFEDDPLEVMSLAEAQARDWLAYLHSTAWLLPRLQEDMAMQLDAWISKEASEVQDLMELAAKRLAWMRHFPSNRRRWGRDMVAIQAVGQLLHQWQRQKMHR